jgi:hypothetical protein
MEASVGNWGSPGLFSYPGGNFHGPIYHNIANP